MLNKRCKALNDHIRMYRSRILIVYIFVVLCCDASLREIAATDTPKEDVTVQVDIQFPQYLWNNKQPAESAYKIIHAEAPPQWTVLSLFDAIEGIMHTNEKIFASKPRLDEEYNQWGIKLSIDYKESSNEVPASDVYSMPLSKLDADGGSIKIDFETLPNSGSRTHVGEVFLESLARLPEYFIFPVEFSQVRIALNNESQVVEVFHIPNDLLVSDFIEHLLDLSFDFSGIKESNDRRAIRDLHTRLISMVHGGAHISMDTYIGDLPKDMVLLKFDYPSVLGDLLLTLSGTAIYDFGTVMATKDRNIAISKIVIPKLDMKICTSDPFYPTVSDLSKGALNSCFSNTTYKSSFDATLNDYDAFVNSAIMEAQLKRESLPTDSHVEKLPKTLYPDCELSSLSFYAIGGDSSVDLILWRILEAAQIDIYSSDNFNVCAGTSLEDCLPIAWTKSEEANKSISFIVPNPVAITQIKGSTRGLARFVLARSHGLSIFVIRNIGAMLPFDVLSGAGSKSIVSHTSSGAVEKHLNDIKLSVIDYLSLQIDIPSLGGASSKIILEDIPYTLNLEELLCFISTSRVFLYHVSNDLTWRYTRLCLKRNLGTCLEFPPGTSMSKIKSDLNEHEGARLVLALRNASAAYPNYPPLEKEHQEKSFFIAVNPRFKIQEPTFNVYIALQNPLGFYVTGVPRGTTILELRDAIVSGIKSNETLPIKLPTGMTPDGLGLFDINQGKPLDDTKLVESCDTNMYYSHRIHEDNQNLYSKAKPFKSSEDATDNTTKPALIGLDFNYRPMSSTRFRGRLNGMAKSVLVFSEKTIIQNSD